jgi:DNA relaxase NicK
MGTHVDLPGTACRQLEGEGAVTEWDLALAEWLGRGVRASRIDIALDDRQGVISLDEVYDCARAENFSSKLISWTHTEKGSRGDPTIGRSISFGAETSATTVLIYDKAAEMRTSGPWVRVELRQRDARAQAAARAIARDGLGIAPNLLRGYLDFKRPGLHSQRERWPSQPWWSEFLNHATPERLRIKRAPSTLERRFGWLKRQVAPTLAQIALNDDYGPDALRDLLSLGAERIPPTMAAQPPDQCE